MITVIDSPCGHGKTTYVINYINENFTKNFVYITPYLEEVARVVKKTSPHEKIERFKTPQFNEKDLTKLKNFIQLIIKQANIASTHALFKLCTEELIDVIKAGHYTLILDEVMSVVETVKLKKNSLDLLLKAECIHIDETTHRITWIQDPKFDTDYNYLKNLCLSGLLYLINGNVIIWTFPYTIFEAFDDVIICTYMFHAQIQRHYFDLHNIKYEIKSIFNGELIEYAPEKDNTHLLHVLQNSKLNNIGIGYYDLSKNWYEKHPKMHKTVKQNVLNFVTNIVRAKSNDVIWTTFTDYKHKIKGKGYTKGFVACNERATNKHKDKHCVVYAINTFLNPNIREYFKGYGITIDEDAYALSEMIQFIWRSAIRQNEDIYCYIPSKRMRDLLQNYVQFY